MDIKLNFGLQLLVTCLSVVLNLAGLTAIYSYNKKTYNRNNISFCILINTRNTMPFLNFPKYGCINIRSIYLYFESLKYKTRLTRKSIIVILVGVIVTSMVNGVYTPFSGTLFYCKNIYGIVSTKRSQHK